MPVDLVIVRVAKDGSLKNSAPCFKCIEYMAWLNRKTTYRLGNIYYSDVTGNVIKVKFTDLYFSEEKHISMRFRDDIYPIVKKKDSVLKELKDKKRDISPTKKKWSPKIKKKGRK